MKKFFQNMMNLMNKENIPYFQDAYWSDIKYITIFRHF